MAGAAIPWYNMLHDSDVEVLRAELQQAEQDLTCQVKRVSELTTELDMDTQKSQSLSGQVEQLTAELQREWTWRLEMIYQMERQKDAHWEELRQAKQVNANVEVHLVDKASELTTQVDMETDQNLSKVEQLTAELQKEQIRGLEKSDQMEKLKYSLWQQLLKAKQANAAQVAHVPKFVGLQKSNFNLIHKLKIEKNLNGTLEREAARLSTQLETEIKKIETLSKQEEYFTAELQRERTWRLEMIYQMEKLKVAHQQELLEAKQVNAAGEAHLVQRVRELTTELEMETKENKSLSEQVEQLTAELQVEQTRSLEQSDQMEELKDALRQQLLKAKQVNAARVAQLHKFVDLQKTNFDLNNKLKIEKNLNDALEREAARLSTQLEKEINKIESLSKQEEYFTAELQREWTWRLEMIIRMEKQNSSQQQELLEAKQANAARVTHLHEFVDLQNSNVDLNQKFKIEKNLNRTLEREAARLSTQLEAEIKENNDLSRLGESVRAKMQKEQTRRVELIVQLQALAQANVETEDPE
ncbi:putative leucine-rich repeat-containing protein DDB G0290503 [Scophthalmus maximus]|uniref:Putative leucine-rich repeat-containing protein DDB G0290503 n=1 Tax=Scophthalmus maximus TaxID=52904 RepID=A0A2U9CJB6_SCOMX|nr:putative leucine-rich repeat-containing protein DDB G0290503 [Scophthalmus maximus]